MHPSRVLLPISASGDDRAWRLAADVADRFDVSLILFSAVEDAHEVAAQESHLEDVRRQVHERHPRLTVTAEVVVDPHGPDAVARRVDETTLPVLATSGRPFIHAGYLGSAAEHVIRRAQRPVLMAGPGLDANQGLDARRIIVPIDGSPLGEEALDVAQTWSRRLELPLWVVSVVGTGSWLTSPTTDQTSGSSAARLRELAARHEAQWEVLHARAPAAALASAAGSDALVIMSSHGRSGIRRLALGSVAAELTRHAACPVMVVAPGPDRREASAPTGEAALRSGR